MGSQNTLAFSIDNEGTFVSQKAASRTDEGQTHLIAMHHHVLHDETAVGKLFNYRALEFRRNIGYHFFKRFELNAVLFLDDYLRLRHCHFVTFAAHVFEQYGNMHFAAAEDFERIALRKVHFKTDVDLELFLQTLFDLAAGNELALAAGERRGVRHEAQADCRLIHLNGRKRRRGFIVCEGLADIHIREAGNESDVSGVDGISLYLAGAFKCRNLDHFPLLDRLAFVSHEKVLALAHFAAIDASHGQTAEEVVVAQVKYLSG